MKRDEQKNNSNSNNNKAEVCDTRIQKDSTETGSELCHKNANRIVNIVMNYVTLLVYLPFIVRMVSLRMYTVMTIWATIQVRKGKLDSKLWLMTAR